MALSPSCVIRIHGFAGTLSAALLTLACEPPAPEPEPVVRPVKMIEIGGPGTTVRREYPGAIEPTLNADLSFDVDGRIEEFLVVEGQEVKQGELLARLDERDYKSDLDAAKAEQGRAKAFLDRVRKASRTGAISAQELTDAEARNSQAEAQLRIKQKAYDDTFLRAPFEGRVARRLVRDFKSVLSKQAVLVLQDDSRLEIKVDVPERDMSGSQRNASNEERTRRIKPRVVVTSIPDREFPAEVTELATTADTETRTFEATLAFEKPDDTRILPGMTAKVIVDVPLDDDVIRLPARSAIGDDTGAAYVWRIDPDSMTASRAPVRLGPLVGGDVQIVSGLSAGDLVAVSGVNQLREGMRVSRYQP